MFGLKHSFIRHRIRRKRRAHIRSIIKRHFPVMTACGRQKEFYTAFGDKPDLAGQCQLSIPNSDVRTIHSYLIQDHPILSDRAYFLMVAIDYTMRGTAEVVVRCKKRDLVVSAIY